MLTPDQRQAILAFDTCKIANAIEALHLRMRNEGYTHPGLRCVTGYPRALGYAVTSRVKCADPLMKGYSYSDLAEWWAVFHTRPSPRIAVIEDVDETPGQGSVLSDVHASVLQALQCHAVVTNGAVRNIPALAEMGFPAFSCHITLSHAYVHLVEFGCPVNILGLSVSPAELIYVDVHGVLAIPEESVEDIIRVAGETARIEKTVIDLCRTKPFSFDRLREAVRHL